ncbi:hypothetical protein L1987_78384 [Smallanthus sonchifolius]|uniref:Uncharacterized protein n=1 Tax=Smallanthus sonchifolius TaxID=185202 RepID=A0ACB8ZC81_9ASTR|nr:hypothetical protein L1987_78384 [Smallanthus sonchifolius]
MASTLATPLIRDTSIPVLRRSPPQCTTTAAFGSHLLLIFLSFSRRSPILTASTVEAVTGGVAAVVGAVTRDGGYEIGTAARHQTTDSE